MGAALAFYTFFAIAPLFVIVLAMAGFWFGEQAARRELFSQISGLVGSEGAVAIQALVSAAHKPKTGAWATVIAVVTLFVGATGVFVQLQDALNSVWSVRRVPGRGLRNFIKDRLLSFALIVGIGFLLLVSLVLSAGLSAMDKFMVMWVYYSAQILFFGAKFTQVYSNRYGSHLEPVPGAEEVTLKKVVTERGPSGRL